MPTVDGVIGVSSGELARYALFWASVLGLRVPPGLRVTPIPGRGAVISENRNGIAERAIKLGASWVLYLDDDQVLAPDTLERLLAHDKDIVSGLYVARSIPFVPHVYDQEDERQFCSPRLLSPFDGGLTKVLATGAGCMLVKTRVFAGMEKPWWRLGQITKDGWGDDLNFCHRAREAGFEVWADLDTIVGHQMNGTLWPRRNQDGSWSTILLQNSLDPVAEWPAAQRSPLVLVK